VSEIPILIASSSVAAQLRSDPSSPSEPRIDWGSGSEKVRHLIDPDGQAPLCDLGTVLAYDVAGTDRGSDLATTAMREISEFRFAPDSPLEGDGFEPSVPLQIRSRFRDLGPVPLLTGSRPGTGSSNPFPSSRESRANLSSSISCRRRCAVGVAVADID